MYISTPIPKEEINLVKKIIVQNNSFHENYFHRPLLLLVLWSRYFKKLVSIFKISGDERKHICYCIAVHMKSKETLQDQSKLRINKS